MKKAAKEFERIQLSRKTTLQETKRAVTNLSESNNIKAEFMSPASVEALRNTSQSLNSILGYLESSDKLTDMVCQDIVGLVHAVENLSQHLFTSSATVQTLVELLEQKGIVSSDEMKEVWNKLVQTKWKDATQA